MSEASEPKSTAPDVGVHQVVRHCLAWRVPGKFWTISEDGAGERLRISNTMRQLEMAELDDSDLEAIRDLITSALEARKVSIPAIHEGQERVIGGRILDGDL